MSVLAQTENPAQLAAALAQSGFVCRDGLFSAELPLWCDWIRAESGRGSFRPAAIGRGTQPALDPRQRSDLIRWIDDEELALHLPPWKRLLDELQLALNRQLFLGLRRYECHAALYQSGAAYAKHLDAPAGRGPRSITFIFYLNHCWEERHGGQLRVYAPDAPSGHQDYAPLAGRLILFDSTRFPHEVRPCAAPRLSLTGWFRTDDSFLP